MKIKVSDELKYNIEVKDIKVLKLLESLEDSSISFRPADSEKVINYNVSGRERRSTVPFSVNIDELSETVGYIFESKAEFLKSVEGSLRLELSNTQASYYRGEELPSRFYVPKFEISLETSKEHTEKGLDIVKRAIKALDAYYSAFHSKVKINITKP